LITARSDGDRPSCSAGTRAELVAASPLYAELAATQFLATAIRDI
jgi:hypothetical protein